MTSSLSAVENCIFDQLLRAIIPPLKNVVEHDQTKSASAGFLLGSKQFESFSDGMYSNEMDPMVEEAAQLAIKIAWCKAACPLHLRTKTAR